MKAFQRLTLRRAAVLVALALLAGGATAVLVRGQGGAESRTARVRLAPLDDQHLRQRFGVLSRADSNRCSLASADLDTLAVDGRLQGSCCRPMVYARYIEQVRGLRRFAAVADVPRDPYDVPVGLARRLIGYDGQIQLDAARQRIYDNAVRLSHEHGPCCCRCWRWTAFRGQAKKLIADRRSSARRIATIWDLEDGCGGGA